MRAPRFVDRRRFLAASAVALVVAGTADAQQPSGTHRIAIVNRVGRASDTDPSPTRFWLAWRQEMRRLGYVEGANLIIDRWSAEEDAGRIRGLVGEVLDRKPGVIFSATRRVLDVLRTMATPVPVVGITIDPVGSGMAASLARPGGNITGLTLDTGDPLGLIAKRFALLKEIVPSAARIGILTLREYREGRFADMMREAAARNGMTAIDASFVPPVTEAEFRRAFAAMVRDGADCFFTAGVEENFVHRRVAAELALATRLPGVHLARELVDAGGLIAYAIDLADIYRRAAGYIDRILKGARPGDLPFEQPTKFEIIVNLKAAAALGLTVPTSLLARVDEVIE